MRTVLEASWTQVEGGSVWVGCWGWARKAPQRVWHWTQLPRCWGSDRWSSLPKTTQLVIRGATEQIQVCQHQSSSYYAEGRNEEPGRCPQLLLSKPEEAEGPLSRPMTYCETPRIKNWPSFLIWKILGRLSGTRLYLILNHVVPLVP